MAGITLINTGLSAGGGRQLLGSTSFLKYGFTLIDHDGAEHRHEDGPVALNQFIETHIAPWEKSALLEKKAAGEFVARIKSTAQRFGGEAQEWDHLILSFDREESASLSQEDKDAYRQALIELCNSNRFHDQKNNIPIDGQGRRMVVISEGHDDTGNFHFHILLHRFPVDRPKKEIFAGVVLRVSDQAYHANRLNGILKEKGLRPITHWTRDGKSIFEDWGSRAAAGAAEVKEQVAQMIEDAGGTPSLDVQPAVSPETGKEIVEKRVKLPAEAEQILSYIKMNERAAKRATAEAQEAAQQIALGQHALRAIEEAVEAQTAKAAAETEKAQVEQRLEEVQGVVAQLNDQVSSVNKSLEQAKSVTLQIHEQFQAAAAVVPQEVLQKPVPDQAKWFAETVYDAAASLEKIEELIPQSYRDKPVNIRIAAVTDELSGMHKVNAAITEKNKGLEALIEKNKAELARVAAEAKARAEALQTTEKALLETRGRASSLEADLDKARQTTERLKSELTNQAALSEQHKEYARQSNEVAKNLENITHQQSDLLNVQSSDIKRFRSQLEEKQGEIARLEKVSTGFKDNLTERETIIVSLTETVKDLQAKLQELESLRQEEKPTPEDLETLGQMYEEYEKEQGKKDTPADDVPPKPETPKG